MQKNMFMSFCISAYLVLSPLTRGICGAELLPPAALRLIPARAGTLRLVCRDCAVGLKVAGTDVITAAECWRAVRARLTELSRLEGVDTSGEWVRYSSLATAHGVEA